MSDNKRKLILQNIPSVDALKNEINSAGINEKILTQIIRNEVEVFRENIVNNDISYTTNPHDYLISKINEKIQSLALGSFRKVINGTGIILHTGLGRAPFSRELLSDAQKQLFGYQNLELDLESGKRGERLEHLQEYLQLLSGAEDAIVVNNNAAALILILNTLAEGKEIIISRGQMIEIGGSFRLPEIIRKSNGIIHEIGTTNRTHLKDYENAINDKTGVILLAHTSNYTVEGFTKSPSQKDIIALARQRNIPVVYDLGSGEFDGSQKDIAEIVKLEFDAICFSGDKLLGGSQSGIILGKSTILQQIHKNPFYRAFRCDKFSIFALEWTLRKVLFGETTKIQKNYFQARTSTELQQLAQKVIDKLNPDDVKNMGLKIIETEVEMGSGSLPNETRTSCGIVFQNGNPEDVAKFFHSAEMPILGYIRKNVYIIDLMAIDESEIEQLSKAIKNFLQTN